MEKCKSQHRRAHHLRLADMATPVTFTLGKLDAGMVSG